MSRLLRVAFVLVLAACSGGGDRGSAPKNLENACTILQEKPAFKNAFQSAQRRWGVPTNVMMAAIYQESKFVSDARTPYRWAAGVIPMGRQSSAYGYAQALDGTWDEYRRKTGNRSARRDNIRDAADFMGWYMNESKRRNGISLADARRQYLAYHEGQTGYARGTYRNKSWLVKVASQVGQRANTYQYQLASCGM